MMTVREAPETSAVLSAGKALAIVEVLLQAPGPLSAREIGARCGINRTTAHRLLRPLIHHGWAERHADGGYRLSVNFLLSPTSRPRSAAFSTKSSPRWPTSQLSRETVHVGVLDGFDIVHVDKIESLEHVGVSSRIGARGVAHHTSLGKALLAASEDEFVAAYIDAGTAARGAVHGERRRAVWADIVRTRERGYSLDDEEDSVGVRCLGAAVRGAGGNHCFAISLHGTLAALHPRRMRSTRANARDGHAASSRGDSALSRRSISTIARQEGERMMPPEANTGTSADDALLDTLRTRLYTAVVSDVLDRQGFLEQAMSARIRPIEPGMRLVGRAHTVLTADIYERPANPYEKEIAAVDSLKPGDVMVAATNGSERTCLWGELLSTAAKARGATGCLIDGHVRDVRRIVEMGFPVFCTGFRPVDSSSRSTIVDFECPVLCGDVLVHPGDIVFADIDGVVVIPRDRLQATVAAAVEKVEAENSSRADAGGGLSAARRLRPIRRPLGYIEGARTRCCGSASTPGAPSPISSASTTRPKPSSTASRPRRPSCPRARWRRC